MLAGINLKVAFTLADASPVTIIVVDALLELPKVAVPLVTIHLSNIYPSVGVATMS